MRTVTLTEDECDAVFGAANFIAVAWDSRPDAEEWLDRVDIDQFQSAIRKLLEAHESPAPRKKCKANAR